MKLIDLTGETFGRLKVLKYVGNSKWLCQCSCGNQKVIYGKSLKNGRTVSCGCYNLERLRGLPFVHKRLYAIWGSMIQRTTNSKNPSACNYINRGISVCDEWRNFDNFCQWALTNGYDEKAKSHTCTLDRIDNDKGYEPNNCRWVSSKIQNRNNRRNKIYTYNNKTLCLKDWAFELNLNYSTLRHRIEKGMTFEQAIVKPIEKKFRNKNAKILQKNNGHKTHNAR